MTNTKAAIPPFDARDPCNLIALGENRPPRRTTRMTIPRALAFATGLFLFVLACGKGPGTGVGGSMGNGGTLGSGGLSGGGATVAAGGMVGTGGMPGEGGNPGAGGASSATDAVATDASPASPIDLSIWSLQLPIGSGTSPTTIPPSQLLVGFSNPYFYVAADGGQIFMDPATGVTTSGSQHCRTELREMTAAGAQAAWPVTGTNTLTVTGKVLQVGGGSSGHATIGQIFNSDDSIPLGELEYANSLGGFELLYEEASGAGTYVDLKTPVALGEQYTYSLALSNGVLTVTINGNDVYTHAPSATIAAKHFYFKLGNYDQTATAGAVSTTPYSVVEVYAASVVHQ
jgi:Alginate lyase